MSKPHAIEIIGTVSLLLFIAVGMTQRRNEKVEVFVEGFHHMSPKYIVSEYHVNSGIGGRVWFGGTGGESNCCIRIPQRWRDGIFADVRWVVMDWSQASEEDIREYRLEKVRVEGIYRARVLLERYEEPGDLNVHFFVGGKVRLVSTRQPAESTDHPIYREGDRAALRATQGERIQKVFSDEEVANLTKEQERLKKKYGDWR